MATDPRIEKILQDQVDRFNRDDSKKIKAELQVKPSQQGHGNIDAGRLCAYDVFIVRHLLPERVLRVWHVDGQRFFPESTTIYLYPRSGARREELAGSEERLTARLSAMFEAEEWDTESANES